MLYDQFGRKIDPASYRKPNKEILSVAPIHDSFREYVTDGLTPEKLAAVFKRADGGDVGGQAELFELLEERDAHLLCERDKRRNVIVDLDFTVEPASDDRRDGQVAEFVEDFFRNQADWDDNLIALQDAVGKGYASLEILWDVSEGQAVPGQFESIKQRRFNFTDESGQLTRIPRLITDDDPMGMDIPPWKTVMHQYGGKSGMANRVGIYRVASWMVLFKNYAIKDWVIFCELFGMPLRVGKYASGATKEDKEALFEAVASIGSDAAGVISKETEIEFIQAAKGSVASDLWKVMADFCDAQISKALLGATLTTQVDGKGSYAASNTHNDVRLDLLQSDGRALASTLRDQLIRPLVGFNFGWDTALPRFEALYDEDEDLAAKADWVTKLVDRGMPVGVKFIRDEFSIPEPEKDEEVIRVTSQNAQVEEPDEATVAKMVIAKLKENQGSLDLLIEKAIAKTSMDKLLIPAKSLLDQVDSLEQFKNGLLGMYGSMNASELAKVMQQAMVMADLSGRFDELESGK